ncbi:MAG: non-hydrolyzing UDP-N-acetylglucosamine 2-epimerase [Methanobacteriaceae archaeon]
MKIAIVLGTRPEIIKMSPIIDEINSRGIDYILIHTGQHYDHEMSDQFFVELELPAPNYNIGVGSASHGAQTGQMIEGIEKVLSDEKPDILLVQGDTNAVLAGAIAASKLHIPVGHVEAGLRSYDETMPEEINRMVAGVCSKLYFVPTEKSAVNLAIEYINPKNIFVTGNTVVDACYRNLEIAKKRESEIENPINLNYDNIIAVTMHRAENVDNKERLTNIVNALIELSDFNIIFPIHPRTRKKLEEFGLFDKLNNEEHIHISKPIGYLDFLLLLSKSTAVLSDSGGLQEEAITLNVPAMTIRYNTERPETVSAGGNVLVGANKEKILSLANSLLNNEKTLNKMKNAVNPYGDGTTSTQILDIIESFYNDDKLKMKVPDDIMASFTSKIELVNDNITVKEFESKNNALVRLIYGESNDKSNMIFPNHDSNLKDKFILFDDYTN